MSAVVGLSIIPPFASAGTSSGDILEILTPGIALITLIAALMALMKPLIIPAAPLNTVLIAPFTAPEIASEILAPIVVNIETMLFQTPWKNSPKGEKKLLIAS